MYTCYYCGQSGHNRALCFKCPHIQKGNTSSKTFTNSFGKNSYKPQGPNKKVLPPKGANTPGHKPKPQSKFQKTNANFVGEVAQFVSEN